MHWYKQQPRILGQGGRTPQGHKRAAASIRLTSLHGWREVLLLPVLHIKVCLQDGNSLFIDILVAVVLRR
jgi:hypothetical protein